MSESFSQLFESNDFSPPSLKSGSIIPSTVLKIEKDFVIVDTGLKSETFIPTTEFKTLENGELEIAVGDQVNVMLENFEDGYGVTTLSREKALKQELWSNLDKIYKEQTIISGDVIERVKGGFTVNLDELRAFLPGSLVDSRPMANPEELEGQRCDFKILKMDRERNNIVVSRKAVLEQENFAAREALLAVLEEGAVIKGVVKNLTDYGAFVDLGGIDGLLHITDMSWRRVKNPVEIVNIGDEIEVKVLKFVPEDRRVSLGLRQLQNNPWDDIENRFVVGQKYSARVTNITDYGCFAEIEEGIEGLIHVSEMDWTSKNIHPGKIVSIGDQIEVMMLNIDKASRRISIGMKQCVPNPWDEFLSKYKVNDRITGPVKSITEFGLFIGLSGNIDGLVHLTDFHWTLPGDKIIKEYKKGQEVEAVILNIDVERERISLGIKQLQTDPIADYSAIHPRGSIVAGKVIEVEEKRVTLELAENVFGTIKAHDLSVDKVSDAREFTEVGKEIEAKILNFDKIKRRFHLSVKAKDIHQDKQAIKEANDNNNAKVTTIGDLLKEQMK